jgi:glycosyltransferase involved in cell wall biosynthesis
VNYLFVHQNFPGQYRHIVQHLSQDRRNRIFFITQPNDNVMDRVNKIIYPKDERTHVNCHAYAVELERAIHTGAAVAEVCKGLREQRFVPDLIVGHSGWGETLFLKDVFPDVPILANFEFYYHTQGVDVGFDPEFVSIFNDPSSLRTRNAVNLLAFQSADWGHSATQWQRSLYPAEMRVRLTALHEGVDTDIVCPNPRANFTLPDSGTVLTRRDEVITYVARNLEPYRGFHVFMRALPKLLRRRPRAEVVIVGGSGVSYGAPPPPRSTFREMMLQELGDSLDQRRVHFVGKLDYFSYLSLLQISSAHVYLTYPFVLSWSFIEALAAGCLVIGSTTPPVMEVLKNGRNGLTVNFFDHDALCKKVEFALDNPERMKALRQAARATAVSQFDLKRVLLPRWRTLFRDVIAGRRPKSGSNESGARHNVATRRPRLA